MNADQIEELFNEWWAESYPNAAPPAQHTKLVCTAFAAYVQDMNDAMAEYQPGAIFMN